jgi:hypothetical protein
MAPQGAKQKNGTKETKKYPPNLLSNTSVVRHIVEAMPPMKHPAALENAPRSTPGPPLAHLRPVSGGGGG